MAMLAEEPNFTLELGILTAIVSVVTALLTALITARSERQRLRAELRTEFMAEEAIRQLLLHEKWRRRSFETIAKRIGGFEDDALRRLLVRSGAIRGIRQDDEAELWGLRDRNPDWLD